MLYLVSGLSTHPSVIKASPPRVLIASTYLVNVVFQNNLAKVYDVLFFISFILAWILSVTILKQYIYRIGKYKFWFLVSFPLFFQMLRYETILNLSDNLIFSGSNKIPSSIAEAIYITLINSDIQIGAIFFGISFLLIALNLRNNQLRRIMIITFVAITLLFASRDIHSIFISSVPPGAVVTISFMAIASYMLLTSLASFLDLASRDKQLYSDLTRRIEKDSGLVKNLVLSEKKILTLNVAKPLIDYSIQWQKTHSYEELSLEEVKAIIQDVTLELKEKKIKK
jgi:hypothetical protein